MLISSQRYGQGQITTLTVPVTEPLIRARLDAVLVDQTNNFSPGSPVDGSTITYTVSITNTGPTSSLSLDNVNLVTSPTLSSNCSSALGMLANAATVLCTFTRVLNASDVIATDLEVSALLTVSGTVPGTALSQPVSTQVTLATQFPNIRVTGTGIWNDVSEAFGSAQAGETISYSLTVTNYYTTSVSISSVTSSPGTPLTVTCSPALPTVLAVNGSITCTATYTIQAGDLGGLPFVRTFTALTNVTNVGDSFSISTLLPFKISWTGTTGGTGPGESYCMNSVDVFDGTTVCTANDVSVTIFGRSDGPPSCTPGQPIPPKGVRLYAVFQASSADRYDVAVIVPLDGGNALLGKCYLQALTPRTSLAVSTSTVCSGTELTQGYGPFCEIDYDQGSGDVCGDLLGSSTAVADLGFQKIACQDTNGDGLIDIKSCATWQQPGGNPVCTGLDSKVTHSVFFLAFFRLFVCFPCSL